MNKLVRVGLGAVIALGSVCTPVLASESQPVPSTDGPPTPYVVEGGKPGRSPGAVAATYWYSTEGDYVHKSGSDASAHGWWINISGPAGTKANVDVQLQVNLGVFGWVNAGPNFSSDVYAGGGAGNRTTARYRCVGTRVMTWRSVVDVDIIGASDPDNKRFTAPRSVACSV